MSMIVSSEIKFQKSCQYTTSEHHSGDEEGVEFPTLRYIPDSIEIKKSRPEAACGLMG